MPSSVVSAAFAAAFVLAPVAAGYAPALSQDFSITNQVAPASSNRRDVMKQLQAWWDVHAYYPRHASNNDEDGDVKLHLQILPDGRIWAIEVEEGSGSDSLDTAAESTFKGGFVRPFPAGAPQEDIDLFVHYVLAHRHDQSVAANYAPVASKSPFTIANDPVKSPILDTMLQKTCTGEVVKQGIRNHTWYGQHTWAQAVFFRKPDGAPWVKFYEGGYPILAPVTELGKTVQWTGRQEYQMHGVSWFTQYTLWSDGDNKLSGNLQTQLLGYAGAQQDGMNHGGTVEFTCATETVPAISWSALSSQTVVAPDGDPP